jgi:hypothetical protein
MRKFFTLVLICVSFFAHSQSTSLVISQVYGGGGSTTAVYNQDYVELHNISSVSQSLAGLSIQYSAVGGAFLSTGVCVLPAVSIPAGGYFLVQLSSSTACLTCPSGIQPDHTNPTNITVGSAAGKIALVSGTTAIGSACPGGNVIDVIGFYSATLPTCYEGQPFQGPSVTLAGFRKDNGCQDTDNNSLDFETGAPNPRRSTTTPVSCGGVITTPTLKSARPELNFGAVTVGTISDTLRLILNGSNLTGAPDSITISSTNPDFQVSKDNINWSTSVRAAYNSANFSANVIVRFTPQTTGIITGDISVSGGGVASPLLVPVYGNATTAAAIPADHLAISQIYGGGGDAGAFYNADYVEIFNRSTSGVNLNNYSIQYLDGQSPLKSIWTGKVKLPNVILPAGQYYLVQMSASGVNGVDLPTPDLVATTPVNMSAVSGRLMLLTDTVTMLNCPSTKNILDKVAYGSDLCFEGSLLDETRYNSSLTNVALFRFNNGCVDTDNNNLDFDTAAPAPRNLQSPSYGCGSPLPTITATPAALDFGSVNLGSTSPVQFFNLGGFNLTGAPGVIRVFVPNADFQVSLDSNAVNSWDVKADVVYNSPVLSAKKIFVRFKPQTFGLKVDSLIIYVLTGGAADTLRVEIKGNSVPLIPTLDATALSSFGNQCVNTVTPKGQYQFTLSGTNLTSDSIVVAPLPGFQYSTTSAGPYKDSLILFQPGGTYFKTIYVIFSPASVLSYSGNIVIYGGGDASAFLQQVIGAGINSAPTVATGPALSVSQTTATLQCTLSDPGCTALTLYGVEYSTTQGFTNGSGFVDSSSSLLNGTYTVNLKRLTGSTTYYYKAFAENVGGGRSYSSLENSFTTAVNPTPTIQPSKRSLFFDSTLIPIPSPSQSFILEGYELTGAPGNINVKAPTEYQVSLDNVNFDSVVNVAYSADTLVPATIYVRFVPLTPVNAERRILISGGGITSSLFVTVRGIGKLAPTSSVRISQIFGSGSSTADFNADFVELHNNSNVFPQSLAGMTIQYGSASGTDWTAIALPNAVIPVGGYYLIQMSNASATGTDLPLPDFIASPAINMNGTDAKVALVRSPVALGSANCPNQTQVVDLVGYGSSICAEGAPAPLTLGPSSAAFRKSNGCEDTNDNLNDFLSAQPQPRNLGSSANICIPPQPFVKPNKFTIRFGTVCLNKIGGPDSFRVTGAYLNNDSIRIKANLGYEFATSFSGPYADSIAFVASSGVVDRMIYVRFKPTAAADYFFTTRIYGGGSPDTSFVALRGTGATTVELKMTTGAATGVTETSATLAGSFQSFSCDSLISYGIVYSTSAGFTTGTQVVSTNLSGSNFSSDISGLNSNTVYFYRAFAITTADTVFGAEQNFKTNPPPRPSLVPSALNNFGTICVGQTEGPNSFILTCSKLNSSAINIGPLAGFLFSDASNGTFKSSITLTASVPADTLTVYVKFAPTTPGPLSGLIPVTTLGGDTSLLASGTAFNAPPAVTSTGASVQDFITARTIGTLDDIGCSAVTERGIEYSKTDGFAAGTGIKVKADSIVGDDFITYLRNLAPNTTYYCKAYAKNSNGTGYGDQLSFTTGDIKGGLTLYPVPARPGSTITLRHYPIESGNYTIKIFNIMGQLVYRKDNVNVVGPVFTYPVGLSNLLKTGRYTLQLESFKFLRRATFYVQ